MLKDLSIPHEIILVKTTSKQPFADVLQNRCFQKFRNIHRKNLCQSLVRPTTLLKRDSNVGVFQCILRNSEEQLFSRTSLVAVSETGNRQEITRSKSNLRYKQQQELDSKKKNSNILFKLCLLLFPTLIRQCR